jgi:hypothetical protein
MKNKSIKNVKKHNKTKQTKQTKAKNPWQIHIKKTMDQHPDWKLKQVLQESSKTYKK